MISLTEHLLQNRIYKVNYESKRKFNREGQQYKQYQQNEQLPTLRKKD